VCADENRLVRVGTGSGNELHGCGTDSGAGLNEMFAGDQMDVGTVSHRGIAEVDDAWLNRRRTAQHSGSESNYGA